MLQRRTLAVLIMLTLLVIGGAMPGLGLAQEKLDVKIKASQKAYAVGEPIELEVQGNRDFYLYLFTVNSKTQKPILLTPENKEQIQKLKAKKIHKFPENSRSLVSDESGVEKIVMLASAQPIKLPDHIAPRDAGELQSLRLVERDPEMDSCIKELDVLVK